MSSLYELDPYRVAGSGDFSMGTAGEALGDKKLVYLGANGNWYLADADTVARMDVVGITMHAIASGFKGWVLHEGFIGLSTWTWVVDSKIYASATAGELTQTPPAGMGDIIQVVGGAVQTTQIYFNPKGGGGGTGCAVLPGATVYVGFDECKEPYANYFLCDGTSAVDPVQIQAAIDLIQVVGGTVYFERGTYDLGTTTIMVYSHGMILAGASGNGTIIRYSGTASAIRVYNAALILTNTLISDLRIEATGAAVASATAIGLYIWKTAHLTIERVWCKDFEGGTGFKIEGEDGEAATLFTAIRDCWTYNCKFGLDLLGYLNYQVNCTYVTNFRANCNTIAAAIGIHLNRYCTKNTFIGGDVSDAVDAIEIDGEYNTLINTRSETITGNHLEFGANSTSNRSYDHQSVGGGVYVSDGGTDNEIIHSPTWVTENNVLSPQFAIDAIAVVTVTIPHGLAVTPATQDCQLTVVEDTNVDDWEEGYVKVESVGAVNVVCKVNVTTASGTGAAKARLALRVISLS